MTSTSDPALTGNQMPDGAVAIVNFNHPTVSSYHMIKMNIFHSQLMFLSAFLQHEEVGGHDRAFPSA